MLVGDISPIPSKKKLPAASSFRSPQVILDSDSSSQDDPKDLHRDLLEDDEDSDEASDQVSEHSDEDFDDVPLVRLGQGHARSQRALMSSDSEEDEEVPGRFATFSGESDEAALDSSMTVPGSGK